MKLLPNSFQIEKGVCQMYPRIVMRVFVLATFALVGTQVCYSQTQVSNANSSREQVIAEVTRLGGKLEFDESQTTKPIVKIDLHSTGVTDADLIFLENSKKELGTLRYLDLRLTNITDAGVANIRSLKNLQTLNLFRTQLTDDGLARLKNLKQLQTLLIGGTKVTDSGMVYVTRFKELKKLSLFQTQVSDEAIPELKRLRKLETLLISGSKITNAGAAELQLALPRLSFREMT
jgi:hypothetical protein